MIHSLVQVVPADPIKSLDWRARKARLISAAPDALITDVLAKAQALFA